MCERVAPYLQLSTDLSTLASSAVEDRHNLIAPVMERIHTGEKDYGTNWVASKAWMLLDKTGLKKAQLRKIADGVVNGWATGPIVDSCTGAMAVAGAVPRIPGRYREREGGDETKIGDTNEKIHPCVKYRMMKDPSYKPVALAGFDKRTLRQEKEKGYEWTNGKVKILEYLIKPEDHFTRCIAKKDDRVDHKASDFIGSIDRDVGANTDEANSLSTREGSEPALRVQQSNGAGH
jgi:hypothetical protein